MYLGICSNPDPLTLYNQIPYDKTHSIALTRMSPMGMIQPAHFIKDLISYYLKNCWDPTFKPYMLKFLMIRHLQNTDQDIPPRACPSIGGWFRPSSDSLSPPVKYFTDRFKAVLLLWIFMFFLCLCARLFIYALWSPAVKGLTSWLSFVVYNCEFVTFPLVSWVRCGT